MWKSLSLAMTAGIAFSEPAFVSSVTRIKLYEEDRRGQLTFTLENQMPYPVTFYAVETWATSAPGPPLKCSIREGAYLERARYEDRRGGSGERVEVFAAEVVERREVAGLCGVDLLVCPRAEGARCVPSSPRQPQKPACLRAWLSKSTPLPSRDRKGAVLVTNW